MLYIDGRKREKITDYTFYHVSYTTHRIKINPMKYNFSFSQNTQKIDLTNN